MPYGSYSNVMRLRVTDFDGEGETVCDLMVWISGESEHGLIVMAEDLIYGDVIELLEFTAPSAAGSSELAGDRKWRHFNVGVQVGVLRSPPPSSALGPSLNAVTVRRQPGFQSFSDLPPTIRYAIGIDLDEIDLGDSAASFEGHSMMMRRGADVGGALNECVLVAL